MKVSTDAMIVVGALGVAAFLAAQGVRQEWKLSQSNQPGMVRFEVERQRPGHRSINSWDVPLSDFHDLNLHAFGVTRFEYMQDAGSLLCEGRFVFGRGSGTFVVQADPHFAARLEALGYERPADEQVWDMITTPVSLEFARGVRDAGLYVTTTKLIELRAQGLTLSYIQRMQEMHPGLSVSELVQLKIQGVSPEFVQQLMEAGYELPTPRIVALKLQGIGATYIRDLQVYGLKPQAEDLIPFKTQGITPEYLRSLKDAGWDGLNRLQIIELKRQGVPTELLRTSKELGLGFSARELIELKLRGVTSEYLRHLRDTGMRNLTAPQILKLKIHGIE